VLQFAIIQPGLIEITREEGVKDSRPTSSLLECDGFRLVIDTEHPKENGAEYRAAFSRLDTSPDGVHAVLFTHLHPDHFGHKAMFPHATFLFHKNERLGFYFKNERTVILRGDAVFELTPCGIGHPDYVDAVPDLRNLGERIYVRHTPGHTPGSVMIFAVIRGLVHAWVGDTFLHRGYFAEWKPPGSSWNQELVYEHMAFARDHADIIIPGHGEPFPTRGAKDPRRI
jgi:glyoxylase-like metal-dependent hydrolase (beta-lactamase superfamily II)